MCEGGEHFSGGLAQALPVRERHGAVAFGKALVLFVEHERDVGVLRNGQPEQRCQVGLPGTRRQQVVAANHLIDALSGVVDHHREVVGRSAVTAAQHHVVHDARELAVQAVGDGELADPGPQPQRGRAVRVAASYAFGVGEVAAGAGVGALRSVRRGRSLRDLAAGAVALVGQTPAREVVDGFRIDL